MFQYLTLHHYTPTSIFIAIFIYILYKLDINSFLLSMLSWRSSSRQSINEAERLPNNSPEKKAWDERKRILAFSNLFGAHIQNAELREKICIFYCQNKRVGIGVLRASIRYFELQNHQLQLKPLLLKTKIRCWLDRVMALVLLACSVATFMSAYIILITNASIFQSTTEQVLLWLSAAAMLTMAFVLGARSNIRSQYQTVLIEIALFNNSQHDSN